MSILVKRAQISQKCCKILTGLLYFLMSLNCKESLPSSGASYTILMWQRKQLLSILCSGLSPNPKLQKIYILLLIEIYNSRSHLFPWNFSTIFNCWDTKVIFFYFPSSFFQSCVFVILISNNKICICVFWLYLFDIWIICNLVLYNGARLLLSLQFWELILVIIISLLFTAFL